MNRKRLLFCTIFALAITSGVVALTGRTGAAAGPVSTGPTAQADDPIIMGAAMRHRQCQPSHWRYVMLRR